MAAFGDDRITKKAPRGQHIALTCKNHPDLRWSTKNIDFIGARSIFPNGTTECSCPASDLIIAPEVLAGPEVPE
jgi:hypothetical protein